jgi:8-oxo-dGTP pyrophosphatase MutT (NUDIX family)
MLDFDFDRKAVPPRDAATLVLVRPAKIGFEIFFVQRHTKSAFMGGALVFPGGKVDEADRDPAWIRETTPPRPTPFANDEAGARAFAVAACREALEEATILPLSGKRLTHEQLVLLRKRVAEKETSLLAHLHEHGLTMDLGALRPLARWVTPVQEGRRFDARFFLALAPEGQPGVHDDHETTASFWASPKSALERFGQGKVQLAPPTHRTVEVLSSAETIADCVRIAEEACKEPICPELVRHVEQGQETLALVLPGDPEHPVRERRVPGASRFVLRGERWIPGSPPLSAPGGTPEPR